MRFVSLLALSVALAPAPAWAQMEPADAGASVGADSAVATTAEGDESPGMVASAVEFLLEGLHLSKRLNKDAMGNRASYRSRS